jgi:hypothetical protein
MIRWEDMDAEERVAVRMACERSFPMFVRMFFWFVQGQMLVWNWHHTYVCDELMAVYRGDSNRAIINCPPGATKTELFSIHFAPWCILSSIALNREAKEAGREDRPGSSTRWLPVSYSDDLVKENTSRVRDILLSEPFQALWPLRASTDTNQKHNWEFTDDYDNRHTMYGASLNGQIMGRRAGFMVEKAFSGALLIDDPLPTKDDGSFVRMNKSNKAMNRILRSRLARDATPIIMIQQRIAIGDTTDYLNSDKTPDTYHHIKIPAVCDRKYVDGLPDRIRDLMVRDTGFEGKPVSYWEWKEPLASLHSMKKADPYLYSSQYQQEPDEAALEGLIWRKEVEQMIEDGRALDYIPVEPSLPVNTYWDLGMDDDMSIWLTQERGLEIRLIAFYKNRDSGMELYINWLHDFRDRFGIRWGVHRGPHDLAVRELSTGVSRIDTAKTMGITFKLIERPKLKRDAIDPTRRIFRRFWIDTNRCDRDCLAPEGENTWPKGRGGWSAIRKYQRVYDGDNEVFKNEPLHNWASHPNDALELIGMTTRDAKPEQQQQSRPAGGSSSWQGA